MSLVIGVSFGGIFTFCVDTCTVKPVLSDHIKQAIFSSPVQSTGRAIVLTLASAFAFALVLALALAFPSRHF